jgi:hypothetical protein
MRFGATFSSQISLSFVMKSSALKAPDILRAQSSREIKSEPSLPRNRRENPSTAFQAIVKYSSFRPRRTIGARSRNVFSLTTLVYTPRM